jgi:hypothetical protein
MNRARIATLATLVSVSLAGPALAQQAQAPEMKPILAGRKVEPPIKGQAEIEFTQPTTKRSNDVVTTTIKVKNISTAPIARLTIAETWFDKGQQPVATSQGSLDKPLEPGAIDTVTIQTPFNPKMSGNSWNFTHANGTIKPRRVPALTDSKAAPAPAPKKKG